MQKFMINNMFLENWTVVENKIIQKTDNINLFSYSIESLSNYGYKFEKVSLDLHKEDIPNIKTEYEKKFSSQGIKINYLNAKK